MQNTITIAKISVLIALSLFQQIHSIICTGTTPYEYNNVCYASCSTTTPNAPYAYLGKCYVTCPTTTPYAPYSYNNQCFSTCPNDPLQPPYAPFLYGSQCYVTCPGGAMYYYQGICYPSCPNNASQTPYAPYNYLYQCFTACPNNASNTPYAPYLQSNQCYVTCPGIAPYDYLGLCYVNCPAGAFFHYQYHCAATCPNNVSNTPYAPYYDGYKCYTSCPANASYHYEFQCATSCPVTAPVHHQNQCYPSCPNNPSFLPYAPYLYNGQCFTLCPNNTIIAPYNYQFDCYVTCPALAPYFYEGNCYSICPNVVSKIPYAPYFDGYQCYTSCPSNATYFYLYQCFASCPGSAPKHYQKKCDTSCPAEAPYDYINQCYPQCPWVPGTETYLQGTSCVTNCSPNYAYDENRTCLTSCPTSPILTFKDSNQSRCVERCQSNPSQFADLTLNQCVLFCPSTTWGDITTRYCVKTCPVGNYKQQYTSGSDTIRLCVSRCYPSFYADITGVCVTATSCPSSPIMYYGDDLTNLCVKSCPNGTGTYAQISTQKCVFFCSLGTFGDPLTLKCVSSCPSNPIQYYGSNLSRQCLKTCEEGLFADNSTKECVQICPGTTYGDDSTRKCVDTCPFPQSTFADPLTKLCVTLCSPGYYGDNDTRKCVISTDCSQNRVGDPLTLKCVQMSKCPIGYYVNIITKMCVTRCPVPYWANLLTRICESYCEWTPPIYISYKQSSTRRCVTSCPSNPRSFKSNKTKQCVTTCPAGSYGSILTYECLLTCPIGFYSDGLTNLCVSSCTTNATVLYFYKPNTTCISVCPTDYFADNTTLTCVTVCPQATYAYSMNHTCLPGCPDGLYAENYTQTCIVNCSAITLQYADNSTNMCVKICPVDPDYYGQDKNDGSRKCVFDCSQTNQFADPLTRTCVNKCNTAEGYFGNTTDYRCNTSCPGGFGNPITGQCVVNCPKSPLQMYGDYSTLTCVKTCPNQTYGDTAQGKCVAAIDCTSGTFAEDGSNLCVKICSTKLNLFGESTSKKCVDSCPFGTFADNTTRKCASDCNATAKLFKDPSTKRCVSTCPSFPDLYADELSNWTCVTTCNGTQYRIAYTQSPFVIRKCVSMCPASPVFYADEQTKTCVLKCANQTYQYVNNTYRGCVYQCPLLVYTPTYNISLFADNTTWKCVQQCPSGYFAFSNTKNICVKMCSTIGSDIYFSEPNSRKCVTECPLFVYGLYGDEISFSCVKDCSLQQFRLNSTKRCVYECDSNTFADNTTWNCVQKCPNGTYAESINRTCVKYCPTDYFADPITNQCRRNCTKLRYYADNITWKCVQQCPSNPDYYSNSLTGTCELKCSNTYYADNNTRKCLNESSKCPSNTVADPISNRCLPRCTKQPMYFANAITKLCAANCVAGLFADNTTGLCVTVCPSPYYGHNKTGEDPICVQFCPATYYKYADNLTRLCLTQCPTGFFADSTTMSCVTRCPHIYYGDVGTKTCVINCNPLYKDDTTKQCKSICPTGYAASNNTYRCQSQCDYNQYQHNGICQSACPSTLFADNLTRKCVAGCPNDPWTYADPQSSVLACVFNCSVGLFAYATNRTCLTDCPPNYYKEETLKLCMNPCLSNQFADPSNGKCVSDCLNDSFTFKNPYTRECVSMCPQDPDLYGDQNASCVFQCHTGSYAQNSTRTCVPTCPNKSLTVPNQSWADDFTGRCVQSCSALTYSFSNSTHNVCVKQCPSGWYTSIQTKACLQICPNGTFAHSSQTCVQMCPNGQYGHQDSHTCETNCTPFGKYKDNSTNMCVSKCPGNPSMFAQDSTMQCVLTCAPNTYAYIVNRTCLASCPSPYFIDKTTAACVLSCPVIAQTFADSEIRECVNSCINHTINGTVITFYADKASQSCVQVCPATPQKFYGFNQTNSCLQKCPSGTFGDNDTRLCLDTCVFEHPKFTWKDTINRFCVTLCPLTYYADNRTVSCALKCTEGFFADNSTRRCVVTCPVSPASYGYIGDIVYMNGTCVYNCPNGLFSDQITRTCVPDCPTIPSFYFKYAPINKCVKNCLYPYFGDLSNGQCVSKCQDGFYGNLTTYRCQACKTQCVTCSAYLNCLTCLDGFYMYNYQCVTSCPAYPILYFAHIETGICFQQCPQPYFGVVSSGYCQLACPTLYFGNLNNKRICTACPQGCITCDSAGCYSCFPQYTYVQTSLKCNKWCNSSAMYYFQDNCYIACPDGTLLSNIDLVTCLKCSDECTTCAVSAGNCTKCATKFLYNQQCVTACPKNYFINANMTCSSCSLYPSKCILPPLTYTIYPFTQNYQLQAYVVFNRVVNMSQSDFQANVIIQYNGQVVKPNSFKVQFYNKTTYWITFRDSQSLNENALSIGFQPGFVVDMYGNFLTVSQQSTKFEAQTGVNQSISASSIRINTATQFISWLFLALILIFLLKGGYPFLIALECAQIYYMFTFIRLDPIPYLQLKFLNVLKNVHFLFLPSFFKGPIGYQIKEYIPFLNNASFLFNCSPFIVVLAFAVVVYTVFKILSNRKILANKTVRHLAKKIRKYRLKYSLLNDAVWFIYLYAMFMAMLQFGQASVKTSYDTANIVIAVFVFIFLLAYTVGIVYLGNKFKDPLVKIPRKWNFFKMEPSQFPMQMPARYIRRFMLCIAFVIPSVDIQCIMIIISCSVFLFYLSCFLPSQSQITNAINITIQSSYIILAAMFYGYNKLVNKNLQSQVGFSIAMIVIQVLVLLVILGWIIYRGILLIRETQSWQYIYMKLTQNKDPAYLRQQQRKRDLQFDWGQFERKSHYSQQKTDNIHDSSSRQIKVNMDKTKQNIFQVRDQSNSEDQYSGSSKSRDKDGKLNVLLRQSSVDLHGEQKNQTKYYSNLTKKAFKPKEKKRKQFLQVNNEVDDKNISNFIIEDTNKKTKIPKEQTEQKQQKEIKLNKQLNKSKTLLTVLPSHPEKPKAVWDDISFDEHQI